jgi:hypothetical protein
MDHQDSTICDSPVLTQNFKHLPTQNSRPGHISKNFTNTFPASGLIPPIKTQKSLSKTMCSDAPARARPPEQEQELDNSKSSSFEKRWAGENIENPPHPGLNWIAFLRQTIRGQIEAKKEELRVMLHENLPHPGPLTARPPENWAAAFCRNLEVVYMTEPIDEYSDSDSLSNKVAGLMEQQPWCDYDEGSTTSRTPEERAVSFYQEELVDSRSFKKNGRGQILKIRLILCI